MKDRDLIKIKNVLLAHQKLHIRVSWSPNQIKTYNEEAKMIASRNYTYRKIAIQEE